MSRIGGGYTQNISANYSILFGHTVYAHPNDNITHCEQQLVFVSRVDSCLSSVFITISLKKKFKAET